MYADLTDLFQQLSNFRFIKVQGNKLYTSKPRYFKPRMKDNTNKKEREKDVQIDKEDLILVEEVLQFVIPMSLPNKKIADIF
ncbi:unnamed protein product [Amaranthus hypochondriacus]